VATVIPDIVVSGVQPMILEYIDRQTMKALQRMNDLALGVPAPVRDAAEAYLIVVLEGATPARLDEDADAVASQLAEAGAIDVFVLPGGLGDQLLAARENAFWMVKAAGADEVIDMVVPRTRIPEYLRRVQALADQHESKVFGCGHAGDGNIHFSVYEPDEPRRSALLLAIYRMGMQLGGAISGEHGIGRTKKKYFMTLEDPGKIALHRRIKSAFDPVGILNPGCVFDPG
jgi:glycolate oxidase